MGIWPANSVGDDIEVYKPDGSGVKLGTFHTLRQQEEREEATYYAMSDFVAPKTSGKTDYIGAFAVSAGFGCEEVCAKLRELAGVSALGSTLDAPAELERRVTEEPPARCHLCKKGAAGGVPVPTAKTGAQWERFAAHLAACRG